MIILKHNTLSTENLFVIERIMLKIAEKPYQHTLEYSLLNKPRGEVYGFIAGIFKRTEILQTLGVTISDFLDLLVDIERGYNDNPYHSFYHAVDIVMVLYHMLEQYSMSEYLTEIEVAMLMLAGLCHDIGHPGKNNNFEVCCNTKKAKKYKNLSVLESESCSLTLEILDKHNFLRNLGSKSQKEFKKGVVQMILATDMICHFTLQKNLALLHENILCKKQSALFSDTVTADPKAHSLLALFDEDGSADRNPIKHFEDTYFGHSYPQEKKAKVSKPIAIDNDNPTITVTDTATATSTTILDKHERLMMCNILIHAADISNPCRPWPVFHQLARLVCIEFFRQGEDEHSLGLPISPNMNRHESSLSTISIGFIDFIVRPYFEILCTLYPESSELMSECAKNRAEWLKLPFENVDIFGRSNIPINEALSGPISDGSKQTHHHLTHLTAPPGTVQIPDSFKQELNRNLGHHTADTTYHPQQHRRCLEQQQGKILLSSTNSEEIKEHETDQSNTISIIGNNNVRRKSEEFSLHQMNRRSRLSISRSRRKSDEISIYLNQKIVSLF